MLTRPHCKINIGLYVTAKRPDGFHNIETLFLPISLCDELEIDKADGFMFQQEGIPIGGNPDNNLCVKAYRLLQQDFPQIGDVHIRLRKQIPFGAGLGGGSSDAAFTLQMLNRLFSLGLTNERLQDYARQLGSDCAVFLEKEAVFATERGDRFENIRINLSDYALLLLKPDEAVSTAEAYRSISPKAAPVDLRWAATQPVAQWKNLIHNQFENTVFPNHPQIAALKQWLYDQGAVYAAMSGSGATVYGLFPKAQQPHFSLPDNKGSLFSAWVQPL